VVRVVDDGIVREVTDWTPATTVNRVAMQAVIEALRLLGPRETAAVYSDSETCVNALKVWAPEWRRNGWRRGKRGPIANLDLVREALELYEACPNVTLSWLDQDRRSGWLAYANALARWQLFDGIEGPEPAAAAFSSRASA
jgi:ribonuclease HI